jgi:hypothetical protein
VILVADLVRAVVVAVLAVFVIGDRVRLGFLLPIAVVLGAGEGLFMLGSHGWRGNRYPRLDRPTTLNVLESTFPRSECLQGFCIVAARGLSVGVAALDHAALRCRVKRDEAEVRGTRWARRPALDRRYAILA